MPLLFVYGTLKRGLRNHGLVQQTHSTFIGEASLKDHAIYTFAVCPFAIEEPGETIHGELIQVNFDDMYRFDKLECGYSKKRVTVTMSNGKEIQAFIYYWADVGIKFIGKKVKNGRYRG